MYEGYRSKCLQVLLFSVVGLARKTTTFESSEGNWRPSRPILHFTFDGTAVYSRDCSRSHSEIDDRAWSRTSLLTHSHHTAHEVLFLLKLSQRFGDIQVNLWLAAFLQ